MFTYKIGKSGITWGKYAENTCVKLEIINTDTGEIRAANDFTYLKLGNAKDEQVVLAELFEEFNLEK